MARRDLFGRCVLFIIAMDAVLYNSSRIRDHPSEEPLRWQIRRSRLSFGASATEGDVMNARGPRRMHTQTGQDAKTQNVPPRCTSVPSIYAWKSCPTHVPTSCTSLYGHVAHVLKLADNETGTG